MDLEKVLSTLVCSPDIPVEVIVYPADKPLSGTITAQPSKNYTTRYLLATSCADGESYIGNCANSDDARSMIRCLKGMGAEVAVEEIEVNSTSVGDNLRIKGFGSAPKLQSGTELNVGNAGAVLRVLLGVGSLLPEVTFVTNHPESLGKRPNGDLLDSLTQLGVDVTSNDGKLPITLKRSGLHGGVVTVSGSRSSQFLSSLLFLSPMVGEKVSITVEGGLVSHAPVQQTLQVMKACGARVSNAENLLEFEVEPSAYKSGNYTVNGDWPGSAALLAAAAVTGGKLDILALRDDEQGEKNSAKVLKSMGCEVSLDDTGVHIQGAPLKGVEFDGDLATDAVLALIGAAAFAEGKTRFYNVSNLRIKECDRITEPIAELRKLGVKCWEGNEIGDEDPDAIIIEGNPAGYEGGITVDGRGDHRVIMLLSIIALGCKKPVRITGAHHIAKSYPTYFKHFTAIGGKVEILPGAAH